MEVVLMKVGLEIFDPKLTRRLFQEVFGWQLSEPQRAHRGVGFFARVDGMLLEFVARTRNVEKFLSEGSLMLELENPEELALAIRDWTKKLNLELLESPGQEKVHWMRIPDLFPFKLYLLLEEKEQESYWERLLSHLPLNR